MVRKFIKKRIGKIGQPPGSMIYVGEKAIEKTIIEVFDYHPEKADFFTPDTVEEVFPYRDTPTVSWINISGLQDTEILEKLGNHYNIHPLIIEDILNTDQRPKIEFYDQYIYIVLKMLTYDSRPLEIHSEQVSIILGKQYVITCQERQGDIFDPIRDRIKFAKGRVRKHGADYLTYVLMDIIIDQYFLIMESLGEMVEELEAQVLQKPDHSVVHKIQHLKRELIFLRKSIWPLREVISLLIRDENPLIHRSTQPFIRDIYDHTVQVIDTVETFRDMVSGLLDIYLSSVSNKMNEIMKMLTIIATIFIPLTFIVGIYGMNFEFMPELKWKWGYFSVWLFMLGVFGGMIWYFKKKRWI